MLERHEVEAFLALSEELHFGRTAERLQLSTARVSQTIARLERRLGVRLFERTSRSVRRTDAAVQLYDELLPAWGRIIAAARRVAAGPGAAGALTVAYVDPATSQLLVRAGAAVGRTLPECDVRIREAQPAQVVPWLRDGVVDVAFDVLPLPVPGIVTGPVLVSEARMLAVPADHALADRCRVSLDDLAGTPVLQPPEGLPEDVRTARAPRATPSGLPIPTGPAADTWVGLLALVGAGRGVLPVGAHTRRYYPRPDVVYVPIEDAPPLRWALFWRADNAGPTVDAFARAARDLA